MAGVPARVAALLIVLLGAPGAAGARAQAGPQAPEPGHSQAREHFRRGVSLAEQRNYEEASREFEASFQLDPRKEPLFAWAQVERLRGNCSKAITLYKRFLEYPDLSTSQRDAAQRNVRRCERVLEEAGATQGPAPPPAPPPPVPAPAAPPPAAEVTAPAGPAPAARPSAVGMLLVGSAVAAFGVAGTFYVLSRNDERDAQDRNKSYEEYLPLVERARQKQRLAAGFAAGGVLLAGGAFLHWLAPWSGRAEVAVDGRGIRVALGGRF